SIDAEQDPLVGRFFKDLPKQYWELTDVRSLGYSFELKGLLGDMYSKCDASTQVRRLNDNATTANHTIDNIVRPVVRAENLNHLAFEDQVYLQASRQNLTRAEADDEINKITLVMHEECMPGSIQDFSPVFKTKWHVAEMEPSFALLQSIKSGENPIKIEGWEALTLDYFNCNTTTP
ncbi:hypothetical protein As57867_005000, partial [Aphanomyces stellatus]